TEAWVWSPDKQVFLLYGYAGTGKTTLARYAARSSPKPIYTAFTGKAAAVMRVKGCQDARNIHQFLYRSNYPPNWEDDDDFVRTREKIPEPPQFDRDCGLSFRLDPSLELEGATLIVIDEASMIPDNVLALGLPILALGNPAQLPPVGRG